MKDVDTEYVIQSRQRTPPDTTQQGAQPMQPRQHRRGCNGCGDRETSPRPPRHPKRAPESTSGPPPGTDGNHMLTDRQHVLPTPAPSTNGTPMGMPKSMPKEPRAGQTEAQRTWKGGPRRGAPPLPKGVRIPVGPRDP